jgi:serine/threonine-protein kinase HipA
MYDVMCGEMWGNVTRNFAQKIAGKSRGDDIGGSDWQQFARACGLNPRQVVDRVGVLAKSALAEAAPAAVEVAAMPAGPHPILAQAREAVEQRARALLAQLREAGEGTAVKGEAAAAAEAGA